MELRLPPGYHAHHDPDVLSLRRSDGSVLALFSVCGYVAEEVHRAAWEDHGEAAKERSNAEKRESLGAPYP